VASNAGHPEIFEQAGKFANIMVHTVLPETRANAGTTAG
jgi:hypothetical protein